MKASHHPPKEVVEHSIILILPHTIVRVEMNMCFTKSMLRKEMVEHADNCVSSLVRVIRLIYKVVYLPWKALTAHTEDGTFSRCKEIDRTGLQRVEGVMYLLCHIERIVDHTIQ